MTRKTESFDRVLRRTSDWHEYSRPTQRSEIQGRPRAPGSLETNVTVLDDSACWCSQPRNHQKPFILSNTRARRSSNSDSRAPWFPQLVEQPWLDNIMSPYQKGTRAGNDVGAKATLSSTNNLEVDPMTFKFTTVGRARGDRRSLARSTSQRVTLITTPADCNRSRSHFGAIPRQSDCPEGNSLPSCCSVDAAKTLRSSGLYTLKQVSARQYGWCLRTGVRTLRGRK